jgi:hypothetical protein
MAMFTAYFDGSGSPDEGKALVVAGYLATVDQWLEFNREWTECLTKEGVAAFHMRNFAHSRREFATWKDDGPRRKRFLEQLIRIVKMRVRKSIANAVLLDAYNRVNAEFMFSEHIGPPYALCGMACMKDVCKWATKAKRQYEWPRCVFEDGDKHKKEFKQLIARFKDWPDPIFEAKGKDFRPFEAADLVAWENRKLYTEAESGTFSKLRKSFSELQKISPTWFVYTENELRRLCATFEVPKRAIAVSSH